MGKKVKTYEILKDEDTFALVRRLWREYARPYLGQMALGICFMVLVAATSGLLAWHMQPIIDHVFILKKPELLYTAGLQVLVIFVVKGFSSYGESVTMGYVGQKIIADIQKKLFQRVVRCDLAYLQETNSGKLVARFVKDVPLLETAVTGTLSSIIEDALKVVAFAAVMFYQDWKLSLIAIFVFPVAIVPVSKIGKRMRRASSDIQSGWASLTTLVTQSIQGIRMIKGYNLEAYESDRARHTIDEVCALTVKGIRTKSIVHPVMEMLGGIAIVIVIIYGGHQVINGVQTPGAFFSFVTALIMAYEPLKNIAKLNNRLQESLAALTRVFEIIDKDNDVRETSAAKPLRVSHGSIAFKGVQFEYSPGTPVLADINLCVKAGQKVALVGPSGAGKSTLLNLIPRFYDPTGGRVCIDSQPLEEVTLSSLRASMALVSQEVTLFDDTVRNNIRFGCLDADDHKIKQAAQAAAAHDFIEALENGYDTIIGEHGVKLSGGQRQRLSIARAMLRDAPILLLDEATSALDSQSEKRIQQALSALMVGRTSVTIAHRLSTVMDADVICVMDQGRIVAEGDHCTLLRTSPLYEKLCSAQFSEQKVA